MMLPYEAEEQPLWRQLRNHLQTVHPHINRLIETFGYVGETVVDPFVPGRGWTVEAAYLPTRTANGLTYSEGPLFRCFDQKTVFGYICMRDLEVLLGIGRPGDPIPWDQPPQERYPRPDLNWQNTFSDGDWAGFHGYDQGNELYERELELRHSGDLYPGRVISYYMVVASCRNNIDEVEIMDYEFLGVHESYQMTVGTVDSRWKALRSYKSVKWGDL